MLIGRKHIYATCVQTGGRHRLEKVSGDHQYKTVRVTAGVYQGFIRLNPNLTHWHWPGLRSYTQRFHLAAPYVFGKQSDLPCH